MLKRRVLLPLSLCMAWAAPAIATTPEQIAYMGSTSTNRFPSAAISVYCNSAVPSTAGSGDRRYFLSRYGTLASGCYGPTNVGIDYNLTVSPATLFYSYWDASGAEQEIIYTYLSNLTTGGSGTQLNYEIDNTGTNTYTVSWNSYATHIPLGSSFTAPGNTVAGFIGALGFYCASTSVSQYSTNGLWRDTAGSWHYWNSSSGSSDIRATCSVMPRYSGNMDNNGTGYVGVW